jgi:hypothetical protein
MKVEIKKTPAGHMVELNGTPVHRDPIPEPAAHWLAGDLENEPDMVDHGDIDLGDVYTQALMVISWLIPNASIQANALSVAFHALSAKEAIRRGMN